MSSIQVGVRGRAWTLDAKLGVDIPLAAAGLVGKDAFGDLILADCASHKIDTKLLKATAAAPTTTAAAAPSAANTSGAVAAASRSPSARR